MFHRHLRIAILPTGCPEVKDIVTEKFSGRNQNVNSLLRQIFLNKNTNG